MANKIVIGVTGNIATGKSLILRMLQELGTTVIDADVVAHQMMRPDGPAYGPVVEEFGKFIVDDTGHINRARLGSLAFCDAEVMARLEELTHPSVRESIMQQIEAAPTQVVAVEAIKLFETGLADHCSVTWVIVAPPEEQLKRLVERRKMRPEEAQQRIKAQPSQKDKVSRASLVIDNSGDLRRAWSTVQKHYSALLAGDMGAAPAPAASGGGQSAVSEDIQVTENNVTIRRAKRPDLEAMAQLVNTATNGVLSIDVADMMEALFSRGYVLATVNDHVVGMAGWQTENLIAGVQDFYVLRDDLWGVVGKKLLEKIHEEVNDLSCEITLVFVIESVSEKPVAFLKSQEYEVAESARSVWREAAEAAREWQPTDSIMLFKKMREQRIMVPM